MRTAHRTAARRESRRASRAAGYRIQTTHRVIWEKIIRLSRSGVEHYRYEPVVTKIIL